MANREYTEDEKQAALDLYRSEGSAAVAREMGIPKGTVGHWARQRGVRTDRTPKTREATEASQADSQSLRAIFAADSLADAKRAAKILRDRMENTPDDIATKDLITFVGVMADKHIAMTKVDQVHENHSAVDAWLDHITGGRGAG